MMRLLTTCLAVAGLFFGGFASAQNVGVDVRPVMDNAKKFSKPAVDRANVALKEIQRVGHKELVIETGDLKAKGVTADDDIKNYGGKRAGDLNAHGVYVGIFDNPHKLYIMYSNTLNAQGVFTESDRTALRAKLLPLLKQDKYDDVLDETTGFVRKVFAERVKTPAKTAATPLPVPANRPPAAVNNNVGGSGYSWTQIIIYGLIIFGVIWLITGVIRAFSRPAGYGPGGPGGPGYAGGGGYGGGGGGGFMSSMLGGLFGAAAGMWMYSHFFGGNSFSNLGSSASPMGDAGAQPGGLDTRDEGGYSGGADDYGSTEQPGNSDAIDNDVGGGNDGGDWGGGGGADAGGGGDWGGGGGGDWGGGGGGGGDW